MRVRTIQEYEVAMKQRGISEDQINYNLSMANLLAASRAHARVSDESRSDDNSKTQKKKRK